MSLKQTVYRRLCLPRLALVLSVGPSIALLVGSAQAQQQDQLDRQVRRQTVDLLERLYRALDAIDREQAPRETFEPQAIVDKVGKDPAKLFVWVRDDTHWVPYRGALRGPAGVLMDRLGNSMDRSLLLAELLRLAGHPARLIYGQLPAPQAGELLKSVVRPTAGAPSGVQPTPEDADRLSAIAEQFGLSAEAMRAAVQRWQSQSERDLEDAVLRVREQSPILLSCVASARVPAGPDNESEARAALADHWWVQVFQAGKWVDLDPLLPTAQPGEAMLKTGQTIGTDPKDGRPRLDGRFCQEIELRVVVEQCRAGRLRTQQAMKHTLRPCDLLGTSVVLFHVPLDWPKSAAPAGSDEQATQTFLRNLESQHRWLPVLQIGRRIAAQKAFTDDGELTDGKTPGGVQQLNPGGLLPGLGGGDQDAARSGTGVLTAEWLEYEVRIPGRAAAVLRHVVFDLIGPACRQAGKPPEGFRLAPSQRVQYGLTLLGQTDILAMSCHLSPAFVMHLATREELEAREGWLALAREEDAAKRRETAANLAGQEPAVGPLYRLALGRILLSPVAGHTYLDSPNLFNRHSQLAVDEHGQWVCRQTIDMLSNGVAVHKGTPDPFAVRLQQGLADTAAEHLAAGSAEGCENATSVLALAAAQKKQPILLASVADPAFKAMDLPADVRTRLAGDLADGCVVVVPQGAVSVGEVRRTGWFRIRRSDGGTVGVMDSGYHADTSDESMLYGETVISRTQICRTQVIYQEGNRRSAHYFAQRGFSWWRRHPFDIARDLGFAGDQECIGLILDHQWALLRAGLL